MHVPQIPQCDNPYELAMHQANINYYQQHSVDQRIDELSAVSTAIWAEALAVIGVFVAAVFVWAALPGWDYDQSSNRASLQYSDNRAR